MQEGPRVSLLIETLFELFFFSFRSERPNRNKPGKTVSRMRSLRDGFSGSGEGAARLSFGAFGLGPGGWILVRPGDRAVRADTGWRIDLTFRRAANCGNELTGCLLLGHTWTNVKLIDDS